MGLSDAEIRVKCLEIAQSFHPGAPESAKKLAQELYYWVTQTLP